MSSITSRRCEGPGSLSRAEPMIRAMNGLLHGMKTNPQDAARPARAASVRRIDSFSGLRWRIRYITPPIPGRHSMSRGTPTEACPLAFGQAVRPPLERLPNCLSAKMRSTARNKVGRVLATRCVLPCTPIGDDLEPLTLARTAAYDSCCQSIALALIRDSVRRPGGTERLGRATPQSILGPALSIDRSADQAIAEITADMNPLRAWCGSCRRCRAGKNRGCDAALSECRRGGYQAPSWLRPKSCRQHLAFWTEWKGRRGSGRC